MEDFSQVYKGKTVLITGHTGFKGSWLAIWLHELGAKVVGYALDPMTSEDNFVVANLKEKIIDIRGDIRDYKKLNQVFEEYKPEIVFHLAAQPIVRESYKIPVETYEVNVTGTMNMLESIRNSEETKVGIFITSDKCYENTEQVWGYRECDRLGGYDPYSASKAAAEILIQSWRNSFMNPSEYCVHGKAIASVRAGNVIGGGDWAKDRIIPDCIRALEIDKPIQVRNPKSIRPWQHVLEALSGYLLLGQKMIEEPMKYSQAWNFGPYLESICTVKEMADQLLQYYGEGEICITGNTQEPHEANLLILDISKTIFELQWKPRLDIKTTLKLTSEWYKKYKYDDVYELCVNQIDQYRKSGE